MISFVSFSFPSLGPDFSWGIYQQFKTAKLSRLPFFHGPFFLPTCLFGIPLLGETLPVFDDRSHYVLFFPDSFSRLPIFKLLPLPSLLFCLNHFVVSKIFSSRSGFFTPFPSLPSELFPNFVVFFGIVPTPLLFDPPSVPVWWFFFFLSHSDYAVFLFSVQVSRRCRTLLLFPDRFFFFPDPFFFFRLGPFFFC